MALRLELLLHLLPCRRLNG